MAKDNHDQLDRKIAQKYKARDKKISKPKMKVTGKSVFKLQELIKRKK
jgi:hypothetical protein